MTEPAYLRLPSGELQQRAERAWEALRGCHLCPWECKVDRLEGKRGVCHTGAQAFLSGYGPHHGEEPPLSGVRGSGAVFFGYCNLRCVYCQNWEISQTGQGREATVEKLAAAFLELQRLGCHNLNLVTPSHVVPQILAALGVAAQAGLRLPLVYNCGGYESVDTLRLLDGVVDIYMPDMKYSSAAKAKLYSGARDYPRVNQMAVKEMYRQVGDLRLDTQGLAEHGLLVRHLVLPGGLAGSQEVFRFFGR